MLLIFCGCGPTTHDYPTQTIIEPTTPANSQALSIEDCKTTSVDGIQARPQYPLTGMEVTGFSPNTFNWLALSGAFWLRYNGVLWSEIEPHEGQRDWGLLSALENDLKQAAMLNLKVILVIRSTPDWAQDIPDAYCGPIKPDKLADFAAFMHDLVTRYSQPPFSVKFWEIWNEPDIDPALVPGNSQYGCWGKAEDEFYGGGKYARMLKVVYPQIKAADPDAQVLVGGLLLDCDPINPPENRDCRPALFMEGILREKGADYFDGIGFHAYDYYGQELGFGNSNWHSSSTNNGAVNAVKARYLNNLLAKYGAENKFLINTESGLLCGKSGDEPSCQTNTFNMAKAFYVVQSGAASLQEGVLGNIWYNLTGWRGTGLLGSNGEALPAMSAFGFASAQLNRASLSRVIQQCHGLTGLEYHRDGKLVWLLWSSDGATQEVQFNNQGVRVYDVWGNAVQVDPTIQIGVAPVYIEWPD